MKNKYLEKIAQIDYRLIPITIAAGAIAPVVGVTAISAMNLKSKKKGKK